MKLRDLISFYPDLLKQVETEKLDTVVSGVTSDSRNVEKDFIFVASQGFSIDGHQFIEDSFKRGALIAVGDKELKIPGYFQASDPRAFLSRISSLFFGEPSKSLEFVGVTGTSGKTTTTFLIESALKACGLRVGVIGTVNCRFGDKIYNDKYTTPSAEMLHEILAEMKNDGAQAVAMEVSSHGLDQKRVADVEFNSVVFTNLTPEHLDYHKDMEGYFQAKKILFEDPSVPKCVNFDDEFGKRLLDEIKDHPAVFSYGLSSDASVSGDQLEIDASGVHGALKVEGSEFELHSDLMGAFNASNILAAFSAGLSLGKDPKLLLKGIRSLKSVPGRLEKVESDRGPIVLVDYAHKPDALEKALKAVQPLVPSGKRLICVMGCGGDRDREKRPLMGKIALALSDLVFVTSDNPRTEDPQAIIDEILADIKNAPNYAEKVKVESDRKKAIEQAIGLAEIGDVVLIAGKGHETYQIIDDQTIDFDDREVAKEALEK